MLEAKDQGHVAQVLSKRKDLQKFFSGELQNFNDLKNSAILEPSTKQFSRTCGFEAKAIW